jgi:predicted unusual protein kinase regulating ubiquinone biosynthesis (AarF/ABC1/UbiB family)
VSEQQDTFARIDTLIQVGLRLARTAPSGRLLLARIADAIDPRWLPGRWGETIAAELTAAQREASAEAIEPRRIEALLKDAWGAKPTDELDELDTDPVAATPTSQVHRGTLQGKPVAVKLLRPGLVAGVRQDLAVLEGLLGPMGAAFPSIDPGALMREFRQRVLDDLDLEQEAANMRRVHRALRANDAFVIPAPVTRLAHHGVLVSEWIDGVALADAHASASVTQDDVDRAAVQLLRFVIGGLKAGVVHADPDPRDVLVLDGGRIAILDFGAVAEPDEDRVAATAAIVEAFVADDEPALAAALTRLNALPPELAGTAMALARDVLGDFAGPDPARLDTDAVIAMRERLDRRPSEVVKLILRGSLAPEDLWPGRGVAQLFATIARVGATAAWRDELRATLRAGWDAG